MQLSLPLRTAETQTGENLVSITKARTEIDFGALQALVKAKEDAENEAARLRTQIAQQQLGQIPQLAQAVEAMRMARWAIGFGIGELHYDNVKGWPWQRLLRFVEIFETMPGIDEDDKEWVKDTKSFCEGARQRELERAGRKPGEVATPLSL